LLIQGVVCARSGDFTGLPFYGGFDTWAAPRINAVFFINYKSPVVRDIVLENVTVVGHRTNQIFRLLDDANNHYHVQNMVVWNNFASASGYVGEFPLFGPSGAGASKYDANDIFDHIYWAPGTPGEHKLISHETYPAVRDYYYDVPQDVIDFTARLNCTNCTFNVDPELVSTTDNHPDIGSPLSNSSRNSVP